MSVYSTLINCYSICTEMHVLVMYCKSIQTVVLNIYLLQINERNLSFS